MRARAGFTPDGHSRRGTGASLRLRGGPRQRLPQGDVETRQGVGERHGRARFGVMACRRRWTRRSTLEPEESGGAKGEDRCQRDEAQRHGTLCHGTIVMPLQLACGAG